MNNEKGRDSSMFEMTVKDLLTQIFKDGKRKAFEDGGIAAFNEVRTNLLILARVSKNRDMSSMVMDLNEIFSHLGASRDKIIGKLSKEELQKSNELSEESINAATGIIDSLENFDFFKNDVVQGEEFLKEIKQSIVIVPPAEREKILSELPRSIQKGFYRAVHEELPKLMDDFYENILDALDRGSIEDMREIIETEKLKWHSFSRGFP
ncbi:hypothetical protein ES705_07602 [subsurface metagenome]|nr:hypothetical protein [Methanosarcinales archaeon]